MRTLKSGQKIKRSQEWTNTVEFQILNERGDIDESIRINKSHPLFQELEILELKQDLEEVKNKLQKAGI